MAVLVVLGACGTSGDNPEPAASDVDDTADATAQVTTTTTTMAAQATTATVAAAFCECFVDLTEWIGTDDARLNVWFADDATWPPPDFDDEGVVVTGVGDDARRDGFGLLWVTSNGHVVAVDGPGELRATLDEPDMTARLSAVAGVVIDELS